MSPGEVLGVGSGSLAGSGHQHVLGLHRPPAQPRQKCASSSPHRNPEAVLRERCARASPAGEGGSRGHQDSRERSHLGEPLTSHLWPGSKDQGAPGGAGSVPAIFLYNATAPPSYRLKN